MLRLFIQELGVFGCIVVAAESEMQARNLMAECHNYAAERRVIEKPFPTTPMLIHSNPGDTESLETVVLDWIKRWRTRRVTR